MAIGIFGGNCDGKFGGVSTISTRVVPPSSEVDDSTDIRNQPQRTLRNNKEHLLYRAAPGTDPNALAPAAPATGEDGEIVGGPR